jgi:hypothetical protein
VLGRRIALERGVVYTIAGVAPPGLEFPARTELWIAFSSFGVPEVTPIGRLAPGARAEDAAAELSASPGEALQSHGYRLGADTG